MRDAIGSTVMIMIIITFIVIVSSYLAYNVNYTKAFRMKNRIISSYEDYDGDCGLGSPCEEEIVNYAKEIGYLPATLNCSGTYVAKPTDRPLYCAKEVTVNTATTGGNPGKVVKDKEGTKYYKIVTRINIQIPLFDNIFNFGFMYVTGDTKIF